MPRAAAARKATRAAVHALDEAMEPLSRHASVEDIHQARAAARIIGDTLRAFAARLPVLKEQAGLLNHAFGEVRDLHVSGVRRGARLSHATASMRQAMGDWQHARPLVDRELAHRFASASPEKLLRRRLRKLEKQIEDLPARVPIGKAHRLRAKAKRALTVVALIAAGEERLLKRLKKASAVLGTLHDLDAGLDTAGRTRKQLLHDVAPALEKLHRSLSATASRSRACTLRRSTSGRR